MNNLLPAGIALALALPFGAVADTADDIQTLRREMAAIRSAYETRLQALEQRLKAAEGAAVALAPAAPAPPPPVAASTGGGANAFNPAMSLILSGLYTRTSRDPAGYAIGGFQTPAAAAIGPGGRGLSLAESELGLAASIDPWLRGSASIALHPDDSVSVEEAFIQTTSLGHGLTVKAGRFFSGVGYLNSQHAHAWDFVDNPLAYQAMLGTQFGDDGIQVRWLAPTDRYLELGAELGRGRSFPGSDTGRNGVGMAAFTAHTGGDVGESHSWRAGLSLLRARAADQELLATRPGAQPVTNSFTGSTRVWLVDGVWKWAPQGNATRTSFKLQGEYLRSTRTGDLVYDLASGASPGAYRAVQSGWYLQAVYQFMPRWRLGLRTERLDSGTTDYAINPAAFSGNVHQARKNTLMVDFNPSEYSRVRLQLARDGARDGRSDNQVFLQYQMSLGAHGAHKY